MSDVRCPMSDARCPKSENRSPITVRAVYGDLRICGFRCEPLQDLLRRRDSDSSQLSRAGEWLTFSRVGECPMSDVRCPISTGCLLDTQYCAHWTQNVVPNGLNLLWQREPCPEASNINCIIRNLEPLRIGLHIANT